MAMLSGLEDAHHAEELARFEDSEMAAALRAERIEELVECLLRHEFRPDDPDNLAEAIGFAAAEVPSFRLALHEAIMARDGGAALDLMTAMATSYWADQALTQARKEIDQEDRSK